jgi:hypothetical protein
LLITIHQIYNTQQCNKVVDDNKKYLIDLSLTIPLCPQNPMPISKITMIICLCSMISVLASVQTCNDPHYSIPEIVTSQFDSSILGSRSQDQLIALIENPNADTAKNYIESIAPYSLPLFIMAAATFIVFIASLSQVICFNIFKRAYQRCYLDVVGIQSIQPPIVSAV